MLADQSVEDSSMTFHRRCEALLEVAGGPAVLDVALNGIPHGLAHVDTVNFGDQLQGS